MCEWTPPSETSPSRCTRRPRSKTPRTTGLSKKERKERLASHWFPAVLGVVLTLGMLSGFRRIEMVMPTQYYAHLSVRFPRSMIMTETELLKEMTPEHIARAREKIPMGRFCTVEEISAMAAWVASPECSFTTGAVFDLSGGRATY